MPRRLSTSEQVVLSLHWFGLNFHWGALLAVAIPAEVLKFVADAEKGRALATVFAGGAFVAMLTMPIAGALSDRSTARMGRRRPFIIVGALLNALALLALGRAPTLALFLLAYWGVQFANNLGGSAYSGLIPDLVPPEQRGSASGFMGLMIMLGTIGGSVVAGELMGRRLAMPLYLTIAAVLLTTTAVTVWRVREVPQRERRSRGVREFLAGFLIDPRRHPDFAWLFASRFLALMGFYTLLAFLLFFLRDYLGMARYEQATGRLSGAMILGALASAYATGRLSDRLGRRAIVFAATLLMGVVILVFLVAPSFNLMVALGVVFGLGYGAFVSVEWALATDVLPSREEAAKYLGVWGISATLPQVLAPIIGGPLLDAVARVTPHLGYIALMAVSAAYFVLGSLLIWRIRVR